MSKKKKLKGMKFALNSRTLPPLTLAPTSLFNFQTLFKTPFLVQIPTPNSRIKHPIISRYSGKNFCRLYNSVTMSDPDATAMAAAMPVERKEEIKLNDKERQIFGRLLQVLSCFKLETQLRVAGGWVRDKLLGKECYDIDIALDNMLGREFCDKVNDFLKSTGEETQGVGVIQCNPEQSKHLETARMRIFDMWIDFVNLRSEDYAENSRIPTMKFGTAEEDAYRRDLTINSLFYNINTGLVEDFTRRGIVDLRSGKIVTPLPPKETFLDDPLRVLRAIRFGARFEFEMDKELKCAASDSEVKAAIAEKISRERIGHEIDLMVSGNQPVKAMTYISQMELFWVVFSLPPNFEPPTSEREDRLCVSYMDAAWRITQSIRCSTFSDEQKRLSLYAAMFLPLRKTVYKDKKGKKIPVVSHIFLNSLKLKSKDAEMVLKVYNTIDNFLSLIPFIISNEDKQLDEIDREKIIIDVPDASKVRVLAGLLLGEIKDFWRSGLLLSLLLYPSDDLCSTDSDLNVAELERRADLFKTVENAIIKLGLDKIWEEKPLVNGKDIMDILQLKTGGPVVREWQQKLLQWHLAYPCGTAKECIDWMQQTQSKRARTE